MRLSITFVLAVWAFLPVAAQVVNSNFSGRWVREGTPTPALGDADPGWEELSVEQTAVALTRASAPLRKVTRIPDGVERVNDTNPQRFCRTVWEQAKLVTECRDTSGGPGGLAPPLYTREVRWLDASGAMVVETTWTSGERTTTRTSTYRRSESR